MISELFENVKVYGRYVRSNNLDGLEYWNKIKNFLSKSEQKIGLCPLEKILGKKWDIEMNLITESDKDYKTTDLEEIYNFTHDNLKMYGEEGDIEKQLTNKIDWEKFHFALQPIRIPKNNSLNLLRLLQIAYNLGQLSVNLNKKNYSSEFLNYHCANKLDEIKSYVKISGEQENKISRSCEIKDLINNLNNFILITVNEIQTGKKEEFEPFYSDNIETLTINNDNYRHVLYTGKQQFVLMSIEPGDEIKMEIHKDHDQFLRIEQGDGVAIINGIKYKLNKDGAVIVPAGFTHQIKNTGQEKLKLYTIYSPPEHPDKLIQPTNPDKVVSQSGSKLESKSNGDNNDDEFKKKYLNYKNKYTQLKKFSNKYY
jgi:mannose-6-phosphate isomerase-like protein (cupin superfamily)